MEIPKKSVREGLRKNQWESPEINLAPSPAEQAVHGVLFTFKLRTFGYKLLLSHPLFPPKDDIIYGRAGP